MNKISREKIFTYCHIVYDGPVNTSESKFRYRVRIWYDDSMDSYLIRWQIWSEDKEIECETDSEVLCGRSYILDDVLNFALEKSKEKFKLCIDNINKRLKDEKTTN